MPSFLQFLIEIIQKDVAQKRRQWPALSEVKYYPK
jgi:hypothetical protein